MFWNVVVDNDHVYANHSSHNHGSHDSHDEGNESTNETGDGHDDHSDHNDHSSDSGQNETVELSTRRGKVEVKVRFDRMIPEGMVFMPFCFESAPVNLLTNQALDPDGKNT